MKLTFLLLIVSFLQVRATGWSQGVTLNLKNATLEQVFTEIKKQTSYLVLTGKSVLANAKRVNVAVDNATLQQVLDICFKDQPFTYIIEDNKYIVVQPKTNSPVSLGIAEIGDINALVPIKGRIIDQSGQPLAGASITIKGSKHSTFSTADGSFSINVNAGDVLLITYVGYTSREYPISSAVAVSSDRQFSIALEQSDDSLNEVVVNKGYYSERKRLSTGNVSKVSSKEIEKNPVSNPLATLMGRVPGLEISQNTGTPGGNFTIRIRGTNSIASGNDPLFIIDGVPFTSTSLTMPGNGQSVLGIGRSSPLNSINPLDIESIEVLKDADATAIYGSRGANGVVLITTKRGRPGKTKVGLNMYAGVGKVTRKLDLLNTKQYLEMRNEAFSNDEVIPTTADARDLLVWDTTRYTDWQKELIGGTAHYTDAQVTVSGGEKNTQFSLGGGYHRETTVFPGDNADQRISFHSSIVNTSLNQKFRTTLSVNYAVNNANLLQQDLTSRALFLPPNAPPLFDDSSNLNWVGWESNNSYELDNPVAYTRRPYEANTSNLVGNATAGYRLLSNLEIKSSFGYTNTAMKSIALNPISAQFPDPGTQNSSVFSNSSFQNWLIEPQLNWTPVLGKS